ncbi:S-adenosyl-L-methionine-dependent methyltransferase [Dipodascopsis tothii]|uniref:S-adenosyl-L-methionine-dependent methyltransferase n=1 Tax=Dipodascopsis tothii TaxID=44089 RepID=UPI0034CF84E6
MASPEDSTGTKVDITAGTVVDSAAVSVVDGTADGTAAAKSFEDFTRIERGDEPFEFGKRLLQNPDSVWDHNAWDHVEWDEEQEQIALEKLEKQKEMPVKDLDRKLYMGNPAKYWDLFYRNNKDNFFKDRKWLQVEFPTLYEKATKADSGRKVVLEVGCGAGNTLYPVMANNSNPELEIIGVDFSPRAVEIVRSHEKYDGNKIRAEVWDLADPEGRLPAGVEPHSIDFIILIFVFSALAPDQWAQAVANIDRLLKPGGEVLFRDYGRYDLVQLRFKRERYLQDHFYVRGDGTRVYFFTEEELAEIFGRFTVDKIGTDRRLLVNRQKQLKMFRIWLQARFLKPCT